MKILKLTLLIFLFSESFAQQNESVNKIISEFNNYNKSILQEKIYIHTDQSSYFTGETIWLKAYCTDASIHKPLDFSKVIYVEVLDKEGKPTLQIKLLNVNGNGIGSIFLPSSLASGNYTLRAYTSWMKNFNSDLFFHQKITIINPFTKLGLKPIDKNIKYDVQFFPEGGNLIDGLKSVVGFRAVDQQGLGIKFNGAIVNENNDTVTTFSPKKFGLGKFQFTPFSIHTYRAVFTDNEGKLLTFKIPEVKETGFVINLKDTLENKILISVSINSKTQISNPTLSLLAQSQQQIRYSSSTFLNNSKARFVFDKNKLGEGINHITLFDGELNPVCERLFFIKPVNNLKVSLSLNQYQLTSRKKEDATIQTSFIDKTQADADLSVSVYRIDSLDQSQSEIESYVWLTSELKGTIESPEYYFKHPEDIDAIENLMLTHGWIRYTWNDIRNPKKDFEYIPEYGGHLIYGKVLSIDSDKPVSKISTYLSIPGKTDHVYISKSDEQGNIQFETRNIFGSKEIIVQSNSQIDSTYKIILKNPFSEKPTAATRALFEVNESLKNQIQQRSITMQVQNIFQSEREKYILPQIDTTDFFGKADNHYKLDDYTRFPTMEEVMREYVPGVLVRKHKGKFHFLTVDVTNKNIFKGDPLVLLDGMPIFEVDKIMHFDPRKIKTLDVVNKKYYLGISSFEGIVSYKTYKGDLAGYQPEAKSLVTQYEGMQLQREFFAPKYETQQQRESRIPDTRNLLYWSPNITTDKDGKAHIEFYTSDILGKYRVVVQGITSDGHVGSASTTFEVSDKLNY